MGEIAEEHEYMYDCYMMRKRYEYAIALELTPVELVAQLKEQEHLFYILERVELVRGILDFFENRKYLTDKQLKVLRIAYAEINSHEVDF